MRWLGILTAAGTISSLGVGILLSQVMPYRSRSTTTGPSQAPRSRYWIPSGLSPNVLTPSIITPPTE